MSRGIRGLGLLCAALLAGTLSAAAQGAPAEGPIRLAVVDMDRVLSESVIGKKEQAAIDKLKAEKSALLDKKQKELDSLQEQIRNASLSWSAEKRDEQLQEYQTKQIELRRLNEDATRDVQAEFNKSLNKLQAIALRVTSSLGKEKGYTLILEKSSLPVLYASNSIDVTDDVISRMNQGATPPAGAANTPAPGNPGGER